MSIDAFKLVVDVGVDSVQAEKLDVGASSA